MCERRVLSGRGLCDEPITRPEKFYRVCSRNVIEEEGLGPLELLSHKGEETNGDTSKCVK